MTTPERKAELEERERKRISKLPLIEIKLDNELIYTTENMSEAVGFVKDYIFKKPFWESNALVIKCRKKTHIFTDSDFELSEERNIMFKDDNRKYICIRCRRETEICGFCSKCYPQVYGLDDKESQWVLMKNIKCNDRFINIVKNDPEYTEKIKQSIIRDGIKNPIILDNDNRILIGHHRYYIAKDLGWDTIQAIYNPISFGFGYFYEGKGYDLYVMRIDGVLEASSTEGEFIYNAMMDFDAQSKQKTLIIECFLNIGSDIRLRNIFIPERGHIVDQTWKDWWLNKYGKEKR